MIPPIIPLTSDTPRLHQHVSRSLVARRHANALPKHLVQIRVALRHHERNFATRSAHTLEANISHDTTNHPAHQRHAAFTRACFALPCGAAPRKRASHQHLAQIRVALRHHERNFATRSAHTLEANISHDTTNHRSPATRCVHTSVFRAPLWHGATQTHFPPTPRANPHGTARTKFRPTVCPQKQTYHMIPPIIPLTSGTPRLHRATQTHFPPRPRCDITNVISAHGPPHTIEAHISHDTTNHPAHQRRATFTTACFALPSVTAPRKRTFHQGRANPHGTACDITNVISPHGLPRTRSKHISLHMIYTANHPAHQRHATFTPACVALPSVMAPRKRNFHQGRANPHGAATSRT